MSDLSEDSLNDQTADDGPAKKKPETLSSYFETFNPNAHVQIACISLGAG
jgi:hypothetical protein